MQTGLGDSLIDAPMPIPEDIKLRHVLQAIRDLNGGAAHPFGDSRDYDVVHDGSRYPPKAIVGLAAQHATGRRLGPEDFSGGEGAGQANTILRKLGVKVERKRDAKPEWAASGEGAYRWDAWTVLGSPLPADEVTPAAIREAGLYSGGQGIFVDKRRTSSREFPDGITVSVLHTDSVYADELSADGILYHYPRTLRTGSRTPARFKRPKTRFLLASHLWSLSVPRLPSITGACNGAGIGF